MSRPEFLRASARARTSKAVSVPNRFILSERCIVILVCCSRDGQVKAVEIISESAGLMVEHIGRLSEQSDPRMMGG